LLQIFSLWLQKIALWLQKIALLFGINCTEINQSQSSNIFMYIISLFKYLSYDVTSCVNILYCLILFRLQRGLLIN
jgi:hypothetical protein